MKGIPTDLQILDAIYRDNYDAYAAFDRKAPQREGKIHVPIDIEKVATQLGVDADMVFGRLYYDLEKKYGYDRGDGQRVVLFTPVAGKDSMCVNFPLLASVVADLREQRRKFSIVTWIALVSLLISFGSLFAVLSTLGNSR